MAERSEGNRAITFEDLISIFEYNEGDPLTEYIETEETKAFRRYIVNRIKKKMHEQGISDDLKRMSETGDY